jgi:signal transduction histidine kinase
VTDTRPLDAGAVLDASEAATPVVASPQAAPGPWLACTVVVAGTLVVAAIGLRAHPDHGLPAIDAVGYGLILAWVIAAVATMRVWPPIAGRILTTPVLAAAGALVACVGLTAARVAGANAGGQHRLALSVATVSGLLVVAVSNHLLFGLPDGRLGCTARRAAVGGGYLAAAASGLALAIADQPLSRQAVVIIWSAVVVCASPALRLSYARAVGHDRQRLQWIGIGAMLSADAALVAAVLHILVSWPGSLGPVAAAATVLLPLGVVAAVIPALGAYGGRVFVRVLSIVGFTIVVSIVYLVVVFGLGDAPSSSADRGVLGLSMLAAAVAAIGYVPARDRLMASATRFVYGAKQAPDEILRTFGSRLTRAVSMDELLLQLAESLRKTMGLISAEVYTGKGDVLERQVSVPDSGPRSVVVTARERPIVTRAGVSGNAWISVWLPALLDDRRDNQLRVAPVSHGGELLGLIVVERPAQADTFSEADHQVLSDLARQVGLAFHNSQLDAALQTTMDELRRQAEALRESRARIVASGDAERRRVERNLHDGAQQHLVALAINLGLARDIVTDDPAAGVELLDQLAVEVQQTIQEVRDLAHGIYPPLLADSGLVAALGSAANRSPLAVIVDAEGVGRYRSDVEAAIYFCCLEALQNAAKHAPGASVVLRLREESGGLLFSVSDDGPGFDPETAERGHGFINMSDRLGAIGGTVRWESEPGRGALVRGSVPLA